jgi:nitroreductase
MSDDIFSKIPEFDHKEPQLAVDSGTFMNVIRGRRSVRVYTPEAVPESVIRQCLEAAHLAPNSSNLHPWEFHWVRSPEKKQELVKACLSQPAARTAAELVVFVARTNRWDFFRKKMLELLKSNPQTPASALHYYEKLVPIAMNQGPLGSFGLIKKPILWARGLKTPTPREPTSSSEVLVWAVKSTALACENYMLTARALGYDTCPMEGFDSARVTEILNLPCDAHIVMVISLGKRAPNGVYGPQIRFDIKDFVKEH